jgi:hypothetical protein
MKLILGIIGAVVLIALAGVAARVLYFLWQLSKIH